MIKRMAMVFAVVVGLVIASFGGAVLAQERELVGTASGAEEVPGPGDADGSGAVSFRPGADATQLCYGVSVSNITLPAAANHIHKGATGVAGPVVVPLDTVPDASGSASGCATADAALVSDILANPQNYYYNVHTSDYPGGAIRAQLSAAGGSSGGGNTGGTPAEMPNTGGSSNTLPLIGLALLALVAGLGATWSARRRQA